MSEPWTFGVEPLAQTIELADLLRRVAGLALAVEEAQPALDRLVADLRSAEADLAAVAPSDPRPRVGPAASSGQRVYLDHSRDVGAFNPAFPTYSIAVAGDRASGTVEFPLVFEGPPGLVHGGVLATFFDCVIQHHNCDLGVSGKTASLTVEYRRPTPIGVPLHFEVDRAEEDRWIVSRARLVHADEELCAASARAVRGERSALPEVSPRRPGS
ncbi:MAG TPA: PaaI family thioesterase [Mycobacteriales bacterium]|nr:PaaI family thioesterase [Mycobacteriales bacterium]